MLQGKNQLFTPFIRNIKLPVLANSLKSILYIRPELYNPTFYEIFPVFIALYLYEY